MKENSIPSRIIKLLETGAKTTEQIKKSLPDISAHSIDGRLSEMREEGLITTKKSSAGSKLNLHSIKKEEQAVIS